MGRSHRPPVAFGDAMELCLIFFKAEIAVYVLTIVLLFS
jgi:hypothetical protein